MRGLGLFLLAAAAVGAAIPCCTSQYGGAEPDGPGGISGSPSAAGIAGLPEKSRYVLAAAIRIERGPATSVRLLSLRGLVPGGKDLEAEVALQVDSAGVVTVPVYGEGDFTVGSTTATLANGTWYRVELRVELTITESMSWFLRVDGTQVGTGAFQPFPAGFEPGSAKIYVGASDFSTTGPGVDVYYDDVSVEAP